MPDDPRVHLPQHLPPYVVEATAVLQTVSTLLATVDWDRMAADAGRAETLGAILDPTGFMASLHTGVLDRNIRIIRATRTYLAELRALQAEEQAAAIGGDPDGG